MLLSRACLRATRAVSDDATSIASGTSPAAAQTCASAPDNGTQKSAEFESHAVVYLTKPKDAHFPDSPGAVQVIGATHRQMPSPGTPGKEPVSAAGESEGGPEGGLKGGVEGSGGLPVGGVSAGEGGVEVEFRLRSETVLAGVSLEADVPGRFSKNNFLLAPFEEERMKFLWQKGGESSGVLGGKEVGLGSQRVGKSAQVLSFELTVQALQGVWVLNVTSESQSQQSAGKGVGLQRGRS